MSTYFLAIATNYKGYDYALPDCILDTENGERTCESFATVTRLNGKKATPDNVRADTVAFLSKLQKGDLAMVYFSGHGTFDTIKGRRVGAMVCEGGGLVYEFETRDDLLTRPSGVMVVAAGDFCYSGEFLTKSFNPHARFVRSIPISECKRHKVILPERSPQRPNAGYTASSANEVSYSTGKGGAWSNVMWKALAARTARTTLPALHARIRKELPSKDWQQTPQFFCDPVLRTRTLKSFYDAK